MKKLRDFNCSNCGVFEKFVPDTKLVVLCKCGDQAHRLVSAPRCFQNTVGKSPSSSARP
jgi:hypothetical protein